MSFKTMADEKLDSAKSHIDYAIKDLAGIIIDNCPGSDEFSSDFADKLSDILNELLKMKNNL